MRHRIQNHILAPEINKTFKCGRDNSAKMWPMSILVLTCPFYQQVSQIEYTSSTAPLQTNTIS